MFAFSIYAAVTKLSNNTIILFIVKQSWVNNRLYQQLKDTLFFNYNCTTVRICFHYLITAFNISALSLYNKIRTVCLKHHHIHKYANLCLESHQNILHEVYDRHQVTQWSKYKQWKKRKLTVFNMLVTHCAPKAHQIR